MNHQSDSYDKELAVTLLSNGSATLFKENSIALFLNTLHTPIILNPSNYHYAALQEIGLSLDSGNVKVPNQNPAMIYFEWDTDYQNLLEQGKAIKLLKTFLEKRIDKTRNHSSEVIFARGGRKDHVTVGTSNYVYNASLLLPWTP